MAFVLPELCEFLISAFAEYVGANAAAAAASAEVTSAVAALSEAEGIAAAAASDEGLSVAYDVEELQSVLVAKRAVHAEKNAESAAKFDVFRGKMSDHGYGPCGSDRCREIIDVHGP